ncbi:MAG: 2-C-methyl-D-erythritol 2,4-cyclodiphosphate synthase [Azoarcus sp.]|jgi:2-C-methyl-D-erythritol 2,4-cyclodiphosphate synthase|nr:2-C-methyl-D-erythritol 2,4-cyclodiphosphate synthase [Azoarcus sp.]
MKCAIRVGQGFDVHVFAEGRPLILGGVTIPFERRLLGYSDADVLLHAVIDALLGAAGQGDIGRIFPDTDSRYKGADSRALLRMVSVRVWEAGWEVGNVDATVICEIPKIQPYAARMAANIADDLNIEPGAVNVKGKTTEELGFTGRGEGIAAQAVAVLLRRPA